MKRLLLSMIFAIPVLLSAGALDSKKGLGEIQLEGQIVCLGCSLKKLGGANAQCGLYDAHDAGVKLKDGSLWSIVNNAKGHDVIRAHGAVIGKSAKISGWIYPNAHYIEINSIMVDGVSKEEIAQSAYNEDMKVAKALMFRKVGQAPSIENEAHKH
jgi:hypothetical protein